MATESDGTILGYTLEEIQKSALEGDPRERRRAMLLLLEHAPTEARPLLAHMARHDGTRVFREWARQLLKGLDAQTAARSAGRADRVRSAVNLRYVAQWDYVFAVYFLCVVVLALFWPMDSRPPMNGPMGHMMARGLGGLGAGSLWMNLMGAGLSFGAARLVRQNTLDAWILQLFAAFCVLFTVPVGPIIGAWMMYNVFKPDRF